jgi:hypothetical protein
MLLKKNNNQQIFLKIGVNMDEKIENQVVCVEKSSVSAMTQEELNREIEKGEAELKRLINEALPGKCPIRFSEKDREKIHWESPILREPYESWSDSLKSLTATTDSEIAGEIFTKGLFAMPGENIARHANIAAQALADVAPQDATEARLCMQEMALYAQGMQYLSLAGSQSKIIQSEHCMKNAIKLLRLHNETIEARSKYRRGGEQRVFVQHVNVEGSAQAIVNNGNMIAGGGGK